MGRKTSPSELWPAWTTARVRSFIRSNIRKMHSKWPPYLAAKKAGRRNKPDNVPGRHKFEYQCAHCKQWFQEKDIEMDHIIPLGAVCGEGDELRFEEIGPFVERMLVGSDGYVKLCKPCHQVVTNEERCK